MHSTLIEFYFISISKQPNAESKLPEDAAASVAGTELARKLTVAEDLAVAGGKEEVVEQRRETTAEVVNAIFNGRLRINGLQNLKRGLSHRGANQMPSSPGHYCTLFMFIAQK